MAVIEPPGAAPQSASAAAKPSKEATRRVLALPKGLVDRGEKPDQTALREVREETGVIATIVTKLGDIKYFYSRSWGDGQRVFKIVSFFLLFYQSGEIDDVVPEMRVEVRRASWIPLDEAPQRLAYRGERDMVRRAQEYLKSHNLQSHI